VFQAEAEALVASARCSSAQAGHGDPPVTGHGPGSLDVDGFARAGAYRHPRRRAGRRGAEPEREPGQEAIRAPRPGARTGSPSPGRGKTHQVERARTRRRPGHSRRRRRPGRYSRSCSGWRRCRSAAPGGRSSPRRWKRRPLRATQVIGPEVDGDALAVEVQTVGERRPGDRGWRTPGARAGTRPRFHRRRPASRRISRRRRRRRS